MRAAFVGDWFEGAVPPLAKGGAPTCEKQAGLSMHMTWNAEAKEISE